MTSRRSFLRGFLALPAVAAVPAIAPTLGPSSGGPIPGYGHGPVAYVGPEPVTWANRYSAPPLCMELCNFCVPDTMAVHWDKEHDLYYCTDCCRKLLGHTD